MLRSRIFIISLSLIMISASSAFTGDVDFGLSLKDGKVDGFYLAISEHYDCSSKEIKQIKATEISDDELPVVMFLARRVGVKPARIIALRIQGNSWMDITLRFGLTAEIFHVAFSKKPGPPYGKAYGHFKKHKRQKWHEIRMNDNEIMNFVNLKFLSAHYRWSVDEVASMRGKGKSFRVIGNDIKKAKAKKEKPIVNNAKQKGHGKKKGK